MPFRTFRDMFPEQLDEVRNPCANCLQPTESILTAYNGTGIACSGTVDINCSYDGREWRNTKFFAVDVPGAAILGLSTCEALHVVTLHCALSNKAPQPQKINNIRDLMQQYPQQFDRIGELQKTHISWWSTRTYLLGSTRHAERRSLLRTKLNQNWTKWSIRGSFTPLKSQQIGSVH